MKSTDGFFSEQTLTKALIPHNEEAKATIGDEDKFEKLIQKLEKALKSVPYFGEYLSDIAWIISLVRSYIKKEYTEVPMGTIISIVSTLIYIASPVDLIPDPIPGIGYIDDMMLLGWVLKSIHSDVEEYKKWRDDSKHTIIIKQA